MGRASWVALWIGLGALGCSEHGSPSSMAEGGDAASSVNDASATPGSAVDAAVQSSVDADAASTPVMQDAGLPPLHTEPAANAQDPPEFIECVPRLPKGLPPGVVCPLTCGNGYCAYDDAGEPYCQCSGGAVGDACEQCIEGYEQQPDGRCISNCVLAGVACYAGTCPGTADDPTCECSAGYAGTICDECAPGFAQVPGWYDVFFCGPTCHDTCSGAEQCVSESPEEASSPQLCRCVAGYHRDDAGDCVWDGVVADPELSSGCAEWEVIEWAPNADTSAEADIRDGEIVLSLGQMCGAAAAEAKARFPSTETFPMPALRFEANGTMGSRLDVSFATPGVELPRRPGAISGTGQWEVHTVCLDRPLPREGFITFMLGLLGNCTERADYSFRIRALSVVSDASCFGL